MKILRSGARECLDDLPLVVDWMLTKKCNYRCSYCFHYGKGKPPPTPKPFSTLEQLKTAVNNIASLNRPWYKITLGGGEPTIHPHFLELLNMLYETLGERLNQIFIITNGSRNIDFYKKVADLAKFIPIRLSVSIHTDHVDMEHILKLIENLSNDMELAFNLMFNPDKREEVQLIYDILFESRKIYPFEMNSFLIRQGVRLDSRYVKDDLIWQQKANASFKALEKIIPLSRFQARQFKRSAHVFSYFHDIEDNGVIKTVDNVDRSLKYTNGFFDFSGMYCIAGTNVLGVEEDGRCRGMVCWLTPYIFNLYEKISLADIWNKFTHVIKCNRSNCGCGANYHIPKFVSEEEAKRYFIFAYKKQMALFAERDAENALDDFKNSMVIGNP